MSLPKILYKTTIVIWSEYDPTDDLELTDIAHAATSGDAFCSEMKAVPITDHFSFPDTEFFGVAEEENPDSDHMDPVERDIHDQYEREEGNQVP
jgi:hypothetical protein